jgi:copper oxidase (laccase) domain-containing protein
VTSLNDIVTPIDALAKYPKLMHGFTTRALGNLSFRTSPTGAGAKRALLAKTLGFGPERMFSVPLGHTNRVAVIENRGVLKKMNGRGYLSCEDLKIDEFPKITERLPDPGTITRFADGVIWNTPGIISLVITADCAAVAFYDPQTGACGNSHVGLLGAVNGLPSAMVKALGMHFGCRPESLEVVIYPCIRKCHYDVEKSLTWQTIKHDVFAAHGKENELYADGHFDLPGFITRELLKAGTGKEHIHDTGLCTVCRHDAFFSHVGAGTREAQAIEGRFGTVIGVRE